MRTFGIHWRSLTLDEKATFAWGLRPGESRALEMLDPDLSLSNLEATLMVLTNRMLAYSHVDTGQQGDPPFIPLPSQADKAKEKRAEEEERVRRSTEFIESLRQEAKVQVSEPLKPVSPVLDDYIVIKSG